MRPTLITHDYDLAHDDIVDVIIANARWAVGLRGDVPADADDLRRLYGPGSWDMRRISGCALVAAGVLERSGAAVPWAGRPYVPGSAVSRLVQWSQTCGCWRVPDATGAAPGPSDVVIVSGPEHVSIVCDREGDDLIVVEGGQPWPVLIVEARHPWHLEAGRRMLGRRPVLGWIESVRLPWGQRVTEPG